MMEHEPLLQKEKPGPDQTTTLKPLVCGNVIIFVLSISSTLFYPLFDQYVYARESEFVFNMTNVTVRKDACYINHSDHNFVLQEEAQKLATNKLMQLQIVMNVLGLCTVVLLGAYSKTLGSKILFLIPVTGNLVDYAVSSVIIYFHLDLNFLFIAQVLYGLLGGYFGLLFALFTYIADHTPPTGARTMGLIVLQFSHFLGKSLTSLARGYFIEGAGYFYPALTSSLLCLLTLAGIAFGLPVDGQGDGQTTNPCVSPAVAVKRVFGFYFLTGTRRQNLLFFLGMLIFTLVVMNAAGEANIDVLFLLNQPFCWGAKKIGYYQAASSVLGPLTSIVLTKLLQRVISDETIAAVQILSNMFASILHSFASRDAMMYSVIAVQAFGSTLAGIMRAILSRMVSRNQNGPLFASIAVSETVMTLLGIVIFSRIYQDTIVFWAGFVYIVVAAIYLLSAVILTVFKVLKKRAERTLEKTPTMGSVNT